MSWQKFTSIFSVLLFSHIVGLILKLFLLLLFCSTFGLDSNSAINMYITTLLLQEDRWYEMEIEEGDAKGTLRGEESLLRKDDMLERALQIVPQLGSTKDLVISLNSALTKVLYCILHL